MASGKQLSFQHGEVSPTQQYRSNEAMYSSALSKLRNFFVLNEGGVANRPGFINEGEHAYQGAIPTVGGDPGIKGFIWRSPSTNQELLLEYYYNETDSAYGLFVNGFLQYISGYFIPDGGKLSGATPQQIRFTVFDDKVGISPSLTVSTDMFTSLLMYGSNPSPLGNSLRALFVPTANASPTLGYGYEGLAPFLPVSYMMTETHKTGEERIVGTISSGAIASPSTAPSTIVHPHSQLSTYVQGTLGTLSTVKYYTLYRSAGRNATFYKLVGRYAVKSTDTPGGTFKIDDYGAEDASLGPPVDLSLMGGNGRSSVMKGVKRLSFYQQRMIVSYDPTESVLMSVSDIGVSKLGTPYQMTAPLIFQDTGAFQFTVPVTDSSPIVAFLAMERLIVFTEKSVYSVRGGTQGILTPTTVNPGLISEEGCSRIVEPKMKGRRGYFLNFDHTKLMAIEFGLDGNMAVYEISGLSEHLFNVDIHTMEVTGGREDTVYLCRRDGKLIRITMTANTAGYSLLETDGFVENIYVKRLKRDYVEYVPQNIADPRLDPEYDALMAYIIRDGVRYTERLAYREDQLKPGFIYSDSCVTWGERLAKKPDGSYRRLAGMIQSVDPVPADGIRINIQDGSTWQAGEPILLAATGAIDNLEVDGARAHIFYDDENGNEKFIQFVSQGAGTPPGGDFTHAYEGYFTTDIPTQLQDVEAVNPSNKLALQTRWILAYNYFFAPDHLANKELSVYVDGQVISSPNNPNMSDQTITAADIGDPTDLPEYYCYGVFGLPYTNDLETLDIEAQDSRTLSDTHKILNAIGVALFNTLGGFFGMPNRELTDMTERKALLDDSVEIQDNPQTGQEIIPIPSEWTRPGRVRVVQEDALPMTIVALYPKGLAGE